MVMNREINEMSDEDLASLLIETERVRKNGWWDELTIKDNDYYLVTAGQWIARRKILSSLRGCSVIAVVMMVGLFVCSVVSQNDDAPKIAAGAAGAVAIFAGWLFYRTSLWKPYGNFHSIRVYLDGLEKLHRDVLKWPDWKTSSILFSYAPDEVKAKVDKVLKNMTLDVVRLEQDFHRVGSKISERAVDRAKVELLTSLEFAQDRKFTKETRGALFQWAERELEAEKAADDIPI